MGFSGGSDGKESGCKAVDLGLIPELGRSLGEGNGSPLQYSCLGNPMDRVPITPGSRHPSEHLINADLFNLPSNPRRSVLCVPHCRAEEPELC